MWKASFPPLGIHLLLQGLEVNALLLQVPDRLDQVLEGPPESDQPLDRSAQN
jgi:hypothetical protein